MLKKAATLMAATAGLILAASPAHADGADDNDDTRVSPQGGVLDVSGLLNGSDLGVCDVTAMVVVAQVDDSANDLGADLPVLSPGSPGSGDNDMTEACAVVTGADAA
jgi:hypothetical protein